LKAIIIFFRVFCITIFPEQAQNKNKVGIKTTILLMMENTQSKFTFVSGGTKGFFFEKIVNNNHIT